MKLFLGVSFRLELIKGMVFIGEKNQLVLFYKAFITAELQLLKTKKDEGKGMKRGEDKVLLTCIGVGYQNMNKQTL